MEPKVKYSDENVEYGRRTILFHIYRREESTFELKLPKAKKVLGLVRTIVNHINILIRYKDTYTVLSLVWSLFVLLQSEALFSESLPKSLFKGCVNEIMLSVAV